MDHSKLLEIGIKKRNNEITLSWQELADQYSDGLFETGEAYRCFIKKQVKKQTTTTSSPSQPEELPSYKDIIEINKDGSQSSNKLVKMSLEDTKDVNFLLKAHGYDTDAWELISARSNIWNSYSKKDGIMQLYSSKITVKPKSIGFSFDRLVEEIYKVPPVYVEKSNLSVPDKRLLELPFFDSHFGVSDFEYYKTTQDDTMTLIHSREWEQVLFIIGQDMLHNDNFKGQTANGTLIEKVDMAKAWNDAISFYYPLIENALKQSNSVKIVYSKGNHDESMSWAFVQLLKCRFPQVEIDDHFIERKIHTFGNIFIGITHGDKARRNLHNLFQVEFPMQWAKATIREIHSGHLHTEDAKDWFGMMVRTLATRNKTDAWHKDNGFVGAHKRFMLFEYSETELKSVHYV
jgi:hypothetical protein